MVPAIWLAVWAGSTVCLHSTPVAVLDAYLCTGHMDSKQVHTPP